MSHDGKSARVGGISTLADVIKITEGPISNSAASLANVNDELLIFRVQLQVKSWRCPVRRDRPLA